MSWRFGMTIELWGGHECTVNRVGDAYRDQTKLTGHHDRSDDLDRFAALGLRRLRYPILWERTVDASGGYDWGWSDERLGRLRDLGIEPIVGLLHHGSGPAQTSLLDDEFAPQFAAYAAAVAERYPWVKRWTPINEPLTTARFSGLYGHWYPHARDERSFWRALINQVDGTRLAMQAIRRHVPEARLIQTDDLGRTYAAPALQGVADHHNERRWMGWDLLCGRVAPGHPFWDRLCRYGLEDRLRAIAEAPCPPDIIGINHYVTSDRYLDDMAGGEHLPEVGYHDRVAARALPAAVNGLEVAIRDCRARYGLPMAVTECHLACTREEQLRWLSQAVETCDRLSREGVDVRAVTVWALLGAFDWDSLLTERSGHYSPGAFDVTGPTPRPTALAGLISALAKRELHAREHITRAQGWWQRDIRRGAPPTLRADKPEDRPILITGGTGTLGRAFAEACTLRGLAHVLTDRAVLTIDDDASVTRALDRLRPSSIVNAAGWVRVDDAEAQEDACRRVNTAGALRLAAAAEQRGISTIQFSSDLVFGGERDAPWYETDTPRPLNAYGRSKAAMEAGLQRRNNGALIIRTAAFFSPYDQQNFAHAVEMALRRGEVFSAAADQVVTPTYVPDLVNAALDLMLDGERGVWHLTNEQALSWEAFARQIARALSLPTHLIVPDFANDRPARRPPFTALGSTRGRLMPTLASAVSRYAAERARCATSVRSVTADALA